MKRQLTFGKPYETRPLGDLIEYVFPYKIVDPIYIGKPNEIENTLNYKIKVGVTGRLDASWGIFGNNLIKVLFEYGKRHIGVKLSNNSLSESEELILSSLTTPSPCELDPKTINEPEGDIYTIVVGPPVMIERGELTLQQLAGLIIDLRDNINTIFSEKYKEKLFITYNERDLFQLSTEVKTVEEFNFRLQALSNLISNMNQEKLRELTGIKDKSKKSVFLLENFLNNTYKYRYSSTFKNIIRIRQSWPTHSDTAEGVRQAYEYFKIDRPIKDFAKAWRILLLNYESALKEVLEMMKTKKVD